jgi:hypothetical protein
MALVEGGNLNKNTDATVDDGVEITGNVAVTAVSANNKRIRVAITITKFDVWIRPIPATTDNAVRKGELITKDTTFVLESNAIYTGEISIINVQNGQKPLYYVTEY